MTHSRFQLTIVAFIALFIVLVVSPLTVLAATISYNSSITLTGPFGFDTVTFQGIAGSTVSILVQGECVDPTEPVDPSIRLNNPSGGFVFFDNNGGGGCAGLDAAGNAAINSNGTYTMSIWSNWAPGNVIVTLTCLSGCGTTDGDGDGYLPPADCNDSNAAINPGASEVSGNGVDENCDGFVADSDGDGYDTPADCNDGNAAINPGATDVPGNGVDEDCSGSDASFPDSDGDGFNDNVDACPAVPGVAPDGCPPPPPPDSDGDGFNDNVDACPAVPGVAPDGCPPPAPQDSDGDGFDDNVDACPNTPGVAPDGCPPPTPQDSDGDGFDDNVDACPNTPGVAPDGCPPPTPQDSDGDGFDDNVDACPNTPGVAPDGCPPSNPGDSDGDGIEDASDNCPNVANPGQADTDGDGTGDACERRPRPQSDDDDGPPPGPPFIPGDDRVNVEAQASAVIYCRPGELQVYGINEFGRGYLALVATPDEIAAVGDRPAENTVIEEGFNGITLWRLTTGEFQINAPGLPPEPEKDYVFIWDGCSGLTIETQ